jgi:hypothetical protein
LTNSCQVRLTRSASGLQAHTWETHLYVTFPRRLSLRKRGAGIHYEEEGNGQLQAPSCRWHSPGPGNIAKRVSNVCSCHFTPGLQWSNRRIRTSSDSFVFLYNLDPYNVSIAESYMFQKKYVAPEEPTTTSFPHNPHSDGKQIKAEALTSEGPRLARKPLQECLLS